MACGISGHWKHPMAYYLQDKCSNTVQAIVIKDCFGLPYDEELNITILALMVLTAIRVQPGC